jgi:hypothetical protein
MVIALTLFKRIVTLSLPMKQAHSPIIAEVYGTLRQHEHDLRAAKARRSVMRRRAEVSRRSGIHGTAAARFGGTINQASTECE